jgi:hypothetical protein
MEIPNNENYSNSMLNLIDTSSLKFRNEDYILKLNINQNLKFFKDELTIKYIGKGYNTIDYAV